MPRRNTNAREYPRLNKIRETKVKYRIYPDTYHICTESIWMPNEIRPGAIVAMAWLARLWDDD